MLSEAGIAKADVTGRDPSARAVIRAVESTFVSDTPFWLTPEPSRREKDRIRVELERNWFVCRFHPAVVTNSTLQDVGQSVDWQGSGNVYELAPRHCFAEVQSIGLKQGAPLVMDLPAWNGLWPEPVDVDSIVSRTRPVLPDDLDAILLATSPREFARERLLRRAGVPEPAQPIGCDVTALPVPPDGLLDFASRDEPPTADAAQ